MWIKIQKQKSSRVCTHGPDALLTPVSVGVAARPWETELRPTLQENLGMI